MEGENMAGLDFSGYTAGFSQSLVILQYLFWSLVVIGIGFFVYRYYQYRIPITLHKVLGDNTVREINIKARMLRKTNELQLGKIKLKINSPPPEFWLSTGKKEKVYFRWDGGQILVPQKVAYNSPLSFTPAQYNIATQMGMRIRQSEERHGKKGFWQEYGAVIMWSGFIIITAVTMWIMFAKLELVAGSINALASSLSQTAQVIQ